MLLPMLILPFITSTAVASFGRFIGRNGTNILVISTLFICTLLSFTLSSEIILLGSSLSVEPLKWIDTGSTIITWGFTMDNLRAWLITTVLFISLLVHVFASSYMKEDPNPQKFMGLLLAFTGFMVLLIAGDNLAVLFVGYEGIGITSYLLIGFWFDRALACAAAGQAIIVNRIGDTFFTLAMFMFICYWGTLDLHDINLTFTNLDSLSNATSIAEWGNFVTYTGVLIVLAAAGKSAQFLLHTWLPNAMEGPTPVSSLLHAATLVKGGIFLLLSTGAVLCSSSIALTLAATMGTVTALFAATTAITQNDIKRVIAYSTCSQFGYLFASVGLSQSSSTVLHLSSHAGFKALLFICAGGVIHSMKDQQDMRRLGGLITMLPFTYAAMLIASLSLMAMPYLSGNVSKDLILELAAVHVSIPGTFVWILGSVIAGITACYSVRLLALTFFGEPSADKSSYHLLHEQSIGLIIPMTILSIVAIFFGYLAKEPLSGMGVDSTTTPFTSVTSQLVEAEFALNLLPRNLPVLFTIIGTVLGVLLFIPTLTNVSPLKRTQGASYSSTKLTSVDQAKSYDLTLSKTNITGIIRKSLPSIYLASSNKWWMDGLFARAISWPVLNIALFSSKTVDRGLFELFGAWGIAYRINVRKNALSIAEVQPVKNGLSKGNVSGIVTFTNLNTLRKQGILSVTNNIGEYALYVGGAAILLTFTSIFNLPIQEAYVFGIIVVNLAYTFAGQTRTMLINASR